MSLTKLVLGAVVATSIGSAAINYENNEEIRIQPEVEFINFEEPLMVTGNLNRYNPKILEINNIYLENKPATEYVFSEMHIKIND